MSKKLLVLAALLAAFPAFAQNVQYISPVTRNHIPVWNTNGVIADGGSSADSPITSIGVTNNGGAGFCVSSDRQTAAGRNQLCFGASTAGPAVISLQNYGTAAAQNLQFVINGTPVTIPTGGQGFALENPPFVANHASCFISSAGILQDCGVALGAGTQWGVPYYSTTSQLTSTGAATNGQVFLGTTGAAPAWTTLSGDVGSIAAGGAVTLAKVNGIPFGSTYGANGVLIGEGTNQFHSVATLNVGQCLLSQGASDPIWSSCASGSGSAGGSNTQVQYNNATALAGSANFVWNSPALTIGLAGSTTGQLQLAPAGSGTGTVTIQNPSTTSAYNFNLPTTAGSSGQPMLSGGGGSTAMSFGTLGIAGGGTNCTSASGTCLDNITGFGSTGFVQRTGSGSYAFSLVVPVSGGGTSLANGTSGGILGFTGTGTIASSGLLAANGIVIGGGAGATPSTITACTNGQLIVGATSSAPACQTMSGDITTVTSAGAVTIANSAITVAKQANAAAWTLEGNFTGSSAAPQFSTIGALTQKASPASSDLLLLQDQAAAGALKFATVSSVASAGSVGSLNGLTGALSIGAGNGISVSAAGSTVTVNQSLTNATLQASPSNPAGTSSATGVMAGLGTTCHITPVYSGRLYVEFKAIVNTSGAGVSGLVLPKFGTGTAPANGVAFTGTSIGTQQGADIAGSGGVISVSAGGIVTGLSTGTAYWLDLDQFTGGTGTVTLTSVSCTAMEF
jgi:hypothetical protein